MARMANNPTVGMIKNIEADLQKALNEVGNKYGYVLKFGRGTYDVEGNFTLKLECNKNGAKSADAQRYENNRIWMRLPPLGEKMIMGIGSREYTIVGINTTGTKVKATAGGVTYLLPIENVKRIWESLNKTAEVV